jgi:hypothetical protein
VEELEANRAAAWMPKRRPAESVMVTVTVCATPGV